MVQRVQVGNASDEFVGANLGDRRRDKRLAAIVGALEADPAKGFPGALGSDAALEAFYRFINNDDFSAADIVAPHVAATLKRAASTGTVIAVHDTTNVEYGTARGDLAPTSSKAHFGFIAHAVLLLAEEDGLPLGLAHLETLTRTGKKVRKRKEGQRTRVHTKDKTRESLRWIRGLDVLEDTREGRFEVIHVTDAEGDFFELLASLHARNARFVIRAGQLDRVVSSRGETANLREVIDAIVPKTHREVELRERKHPRRTLLKTRVRHPARSAHTAKLAIGSARIVLRKPAYSDMQYDPFELTVVRVWESNPPRGEPAIEWVLFTTEDASSPSELRRIVDIYRKRWTIEEYFKALKSGCSLEKRQVESYGALCKVLALFIPIAYRLLLLRGLERLDASTPAKKTFSAADLQLMARAPSNRSLPAPRTVADALTHIARLGGHIRNNGRPGWQTLARGYEKLLTMRLGWELAMLQKSDQS